MPEKRRPPVPSKGGPSLSLVPSFRSTGGTQRLDDQERQALAEIVGGHEFVPIVIEGAERIVGDFWAAGPAANDPARRLSAFERLERASADVLGLLRDPSVRWFLRDLPQTGPLYGSLVRVPPEQAGANLNLLESLLGRVASIARARGSGKWHGRRDPLLYWSTSHMVEMLHVHYGVRLSTAGAMERAVRLLWKATGLGKRDEDEEEDPREILRVLLDERRRSRPATVRKPRASTASTRSTRGPKDT